MKLFLLIALAASSGIGDYHRANELFQQQQFARAAEALDRAIKEDPNYAPAWTLRARSQWLSTVSISRARHF